MSHNLHIRPQEGGFVTADLEALAALDETLSLEKSVDVGLISINVALGEASFQLSFSAEEISTVRTPSDQEILKIYSLAEALRGDIYDDYGDKWDERGKIPVGQADGSGSAFMKVLILFGALVAAYWWSQ